MRVSLTIDTETEAFTDNVSAESARILRAVADRIDGHPHFSPGHSQPLKDANGEEVGHIDVTCTSGKGSTREAENELALPEHKALVLSFEQTYDPDRYNLDKVGNSISGYQDDKVYTSWLAYRRAYIRLVVKRGLPRLHEN